MKQPSDIVELKTFKEIETILVYTGVYNPINDILFHLKSLANKNILIDSEEGASEAGNKNGSVVSTPFISCAENKMCTPDLSFDNLLDAVHHIVSSAKKN